MSLRTVSALVQRYLFLYTRTPIRLIELLFWPLMQLLVWGYLTTYLNEAAGRDLPFAASYLIGAVILWDALFRSQQAVAIFFLEDVWTHNLLNVFAAPVRQIEYLAATFCIGILRTTVTVTVLSILSVTLYQFNVFVLDTALIPFFANLLIFGWALGMISTALIMRWGPAAETLAWAVPFFIQPFAAVFYPVDVLPEFLQHAAAFLPCAYIFEGMREALTTGSVSSSKLFWAAGLNVVYLAAAGLLFNAVLRTARKKGLLTKFASQ